MLGDRPRLGARPVSLAPLPEITYAKALVANPSDVGFLRHRISGARLRKVVADGADDPFFHGGEHFFFKRRRRHWQATLSVTAVGVLGGPLRPIAPSAKVSRSNTSSFAMPAAVAIVVILSPVPVSLVASERSRRSHPRHYSNAANNLTLARSFLRKRRQRLAAGVSSLQPSVQWRTMFKRLRAPSL